MNSSVSTRQPSLTANVSSKRESFVINWEGTKVDYDFASRKKLAGIILLEIKEAKELPKLKNREL
jgi:hypothetical protein